MSRLRIAELMARHAAGLDPESLPVAVAAQIIAQCVEPIEANERLGLRAALGRVLGEDIHAALDVPAQDNSAMDGYAVRAADLAPEGPVRLRLAGSSLAGRPFTGELLPGECVRVMTGALLPAGADAVIMQERCTSEAGHIHIPGPARPGDNIRRAGEDLARGQAVLRAGQALGPAELGLLASVGCTALAVRRRPRVAFFSTGDELAAAGEALQPGQIYDSNRHTLYGMLGRLGVEPVDLGLVRDDPVQLEHTLRAAAREADAVITTGGVSVGDADFIRSLLGRLGEVAFWKLAMRPGRPMAFGRLGQALFFGLPGNPVAVMVSFIQLVRPALLRLAGRSGPPGPPMLEVPCATAIRKKPGRTEYLRGHLAADPDGQTRVRPTPDQGSGVLRSMSEANCLIVLEAAQADLPAGARVCVQPFEGLL